MASRKNNPGIKGAGEQTEFTPEQVLELKKCAQDPVHFIKTYARIQHPMRGSVPFALYPYQERMVENFKNNRFNVVLSARQTGKSTVSAIYLLWHAIFNFDQTILIASNKNSNAMEMIHRIRYAYENLPNWLKPGVLDDGWNKHNVGFDNGSRIVSTATSEDAGRGMSISLLFLDEFAFVKPGIQEEFWTSISPTLSTGGGCIMSSTPNGDINLFAQIWRSAEVGLDVGVGEGHKFPFYPTRVRWDEPPGRDEAFKQAQIATLGKLKWDQEYECEFLSSDALLIDSTLTGMLDTNRKPFLHSQNDFQFFGEFKEKEIYLVGVDPSTGTGMDFSVIEVFHFPSMFQVAEFRSNTLSSPEVYAKMKWIIRQMELKGCTVYFSVENNGVGEGIIALYQNDENPSNSAEMVSEEGKKRFGMTTTKKKKMRAALDFRLLIERGGIQLNSVVLLKEIKTFARKRDSYEAQVGSTDDCIMASLICVRLLGEIASYEQEAFDKLYTVDEDEYTNEEFFDENDEPLPMLMGDVFDPNDNTPDFSAFSSLPPPNSPFK